MPFIYFTHSHTAQLLPCPVTTNSLSVSMSLFCLVPLFICPVSWIPPISEVIWHLSFSMWLILPSIIAFWSFRVVSNDKVSFTADGDCSHEIKRCLLLGREVMTNLDSIFKSRDTTLPSKVRLVKAMVFPVVMLDVRVGLWRKLSTEELMPLNCGVGEDSWESLGLQGDPTSPL